MPVIESGLENAISYKRAVVWQFLAPTARENGLTVNNEIDERYDPIKSTYAAVKSLRKLIKSLIIGFLQQLLIIEGLEVLKIQ